MTTPLANAYYRSDADPEALNPVPLCIACGSEWWELEQIHDGVTECAGCKAEGREEKTVTKKFQMQNRFEPKRTAKVNSDIDRSTCCEACIVYFEPIYDRPDFGGYEGCEECGAMTSAIPERPEVEPMTTDQIFKAMENTIQACGHDVEGEWAPEDLIDFIVSTNGRYADRWSNAQFWATREFTPKRIDAAVERFKARYGYVK